MINYFHSELFCLLRNKALYIISGICLFLVTAAAFVLYYSQKSVPQFPYGYTGFYYSNVLSSGIGIILIGFMFGLFLTGRKMDIAGQAISFGIPRKTVFWSKFILSLAGFVLLCSISILLLLVLGENLLNHQDYTVKMLLIAFINMLPIILAGFTMGFVLNILRVKETYNLLTLIIIFGLSGQLVQMLFHYIPGLKQLYRYFPSGLLDENLTDYINQTVSFNSPAWMIGILLTVGCLVIGQQIFTKKDL